MGAPDGNRLIAPQSLLCAPRGDQSIEVKKGIDSPQARDVDVEHAASTMYQVFLPRPSTLVEFVRCYHRFRSTARCRAIRSSSSLPFLSLQARNPGTPGSNARSSGARSCEAALNPVRPRSSSPRVRPLAARPRIRITTRIYADSLAHARYNHFGGR